MKNDSTTAFLNIVLAALVILCVFFALMTIWRTRDLRNIQPRVQAEVQQVNLVSAKAQALLQDVINYNATAKSPELAQIIQSVQPAQTPAK
jgi:hypothetical protein